ncbi:hypothetical protein NKG05_12490 [Oerskovia sp. M15]
MTELTFTLLRLGYLVLLWVFVFAAIGVLRRDLYGTKITPRKGRAKESTRARRPRPGGLRRPLLRLPPLRPRAAPRDSS